MSRTQKALALLLLYLLYLGTILKQVPLAPSEECPRSEQAILPLALSYKVELLKILELSQAPVAQHEPAIVVLFPKTSQLHNQHPCTFVACEECLYTLMSLQL